MKFKESEFQLRTSLDAPSLRDHYATTYGVVQNSCLNSSRYFHVVDGMSPDIMHDILEGVLRVVLILILNLKIVAMDPTVE